MKLRELTFALCAGLLVGGAASAQDKPMSAEQKAMMDAWAKFATPAEGHKSLAGMVGTWDAEVTSWMDPAAPPEKSKGVSENRTVLGGRWVESKFTSNMMGMPFEGIGYTGYDNQKKKYMSTWMDNMSTAVMVSEGTWTTPGKVMTSTATMDDFMTGKPQAVRMVTTFVSADEHLFEMFGPDPAGKEVKQMEIRYKRKK